MRHCAHVDLWKLGQALKATGMFVLPAPRRVLASMNPSLTISETLRIPVPTIKRLGPFRVCVSVPSLV